MAKRPKHELIADEPVDGEYDFASKNRYDDEIDEPTECDGCRVSPFSRRVLVKGKRLGNCLVALVVLWMGGCNTSPGEVLIVIDTDLPVPRLAARLRVDLYSENERWYASRDFALPAPSDWPASFAVSAGGGDPARRVLVRLRAYPEGDTRDYRGERFQTRPNSFCPRPVIERFSELCSPPPDPDTGCPRALALSPGETLDVRLGRKPVIPSLDCMGKRFNAAGGAAEVTLQIARRDVYRFGIVDTSSGRGPGTASYQGGVGFQLRPDCAIKPSASTVIACGASLMTELPATQAAMLEPGRYSLVVISLDTGPSLVTLAAAPEGEWNALLARPPTSQSAPLPKTRLELEHGVAGADVTPQVEPLPEVAVDRLALVRVEPGVRRRARVTLRGACLGTMARLAEAPLSQAVVFAEAEGCTDSENVREPIAEEPLDDDLSAPPPAPKNTFPMVSDCGDDDRNLDRVCIKGGAFVLGDPLAGGFFRGTGGARAAVVSTFFLDRHEVTVARFRDALEHRQFVPRGNEAPIEYHKGAEGCRFTPVRGDFENDALACLSWYGAQAFCRAVGGDLPTSAQWDYAAWQDRRVVKSQFPWGDTPLACDSLAAGVGFECAGDPGILPVDAFPSDRTPGGIVGMGGNLQEMVLDAFEPYDGECWRAAPLRDPVCDYHDANFRGAFGGHRNYPLTSASTSARFNVDTSEGFRDLEGFRCAYPGPS